MSRKVASDTILCVRRWWVAVQNNLTINIYASSEGLYSNHQQHHHPSPAPTAGGNRIEHIHSDFRRTRNNCNFVGRIISQSCVRYRSLLAFRIGCPMDHSSPFMSCCVSRCRMCCLFGVWCTPNPLPGARSSFGHGFNTSGAFASWCQMLWGASDAAGMETNCNKLFWKAIVFDSFQLRIGHIFNTRAYSSAAWCEDHWIGSTGRSFQSCYADVQWKLCCNKTESI